MYLYLFTSTAWKFICTVCSTVSITSIMFDAPLTIQHTYVQLGIVPTIKDIQSVTLFPIKDFYFDRHMNSN